MSSTNPIRTHRATARAASTALLLVLGAASLEAQLPNASASALALAGNNTASAREFEAISVNPAALALPGSGFSLALATPQVRLGLDPVTVGDLFDHQGQLLPTSTRNEWLARVLEAGGEAGTVGVEASALALTVGNFGLQVATVGSARVNVPPGVVEAALFGNAGRTGSAEDISLENASVEAFATSTIAASYAFSVSPTLSLGVTGKYLLGHGLAVGRSIAGELETNPVRATAETPLISSCLDEIGCTQDFVNGGSGYGLDLGVVMDLGTLTLGASLQNVVNTFAWDESKLGYRQGMVVAEQGNLTSDYDELPFDQAPDDLRQLVSDYTFRPGYRLGAALHVLPILTVTGDIQGLMSDEGIAVGPKYHTGVGAELRLGLVQLRTGVSKVNEAVQVGAGFALVLGPVNLAVSGGMLKGGLSDTRMAQFTLSFGGR